MTRRNSTSLAAATILFAVATAFALAPVPASADAAVGQGAPAFILQDLDGKQVSLEQFRGKVVVLEWMNPNCPFSRGHAERGTMVTTAAKHPEAVWLGINSTNLHHREFVDAAAYHSYNEKFGIHYTVLYDSTGATGHAYGAKTTPHMFVIDKDGKIAYAGAIDGDGGGGAKTNYVDAALTALAAGNRPEPAATRPYGCSVKY